MDFTVSPIKRPSIIKDLITAFLCTIEFRAVPINPCTLNLFAFYTIKKIIQVYAIKQELCTQKHSKLFVHIRIVRVKANLFFARTGAPAPVRQLSSCSGAHIANHTHRGAGGWRGRREAGAKMYDSEV